MATDKKRATQAELFENVKHNGIELRFNAEPSPFLQSKLRSQGFRPSKVPFMWYTERTDDALNFARSVSDNLPHSSDGPDLHLVPSFESSKANIEKKEFSFVIISLSSGETKSYIVFEPSKPKAEVIATSFAQKNFPKEFSTVVAKSRSNIREARLLFDEKKVISDDFQSQPVSPEVPTEKTTFETEEPANPGTSVTTDLTIDRIFIPNVLVPADQKEPFLSQRFEENLQTVLKQKYPHLFALNEDSLPSASTLALFDLIQLDDPLPFGISIGRKNLKRIWERNGKSLFAKLGFPTEQNYPYVSLESGYEIIEPLKDVLHDGNRNVRWWLAAARYRPISDVKEALAIVEKQLVEKQQELHPFLDDKGEPILQFEIQAESLGGEIGNLKKSKQVLENYMQSQITKNNPDKNNISPSTSIEPGLPHKKNKKCTQHQINQEIESLIDRIDRDKGSFTEEEKNFIRRYTGSGGLIQQGATGRGILYEYYTSEVVVRKMWDLAYHYGYDGGAVLEPSVGTGNFLKYVPKGTEATGFETNHYAARIAQILHPFATIHEKAFETNFFAGNVHLKDQFTDKRYSLVIGNPPYGEFSGKYAGMGEKKWTGCKQYEHYFTFRGLDLLIPGGLLIYILPSEFLKNENDLSTAQKIASKCIGLDRFRLGDRIFKTTDINTDILVLKKTTI